MIVSRCVSSVSVASLVVAELICLLLSICVQEVRMMQGACDPDARFVNRSDQGWSDETDVFTNFNRPCQAIQGCNSGSTCSLNSHDQWMVGRQCGCKCKNQHRTFDFKDCVNLEEFKFSSTSECNVTMTRGQQVPMRRLPDEGAGFIRPMEQSKLLWNGNPNILSMEVISAEYFRHDQQWELLSQHVGLAHKFKVQRETVNGEENLYITYDSPGDQEIKRCFDGLIIKLTLKFQRQNNMMTDCIIFKLAGQLEYNDTDGILQCAGFQPSTTHNTDAGDTSSSGSSNAPIATWTNAGTTSVLQHATDKISTVRTSAMQSSSHATPPNLGEKDEMKSSPIGAIVGGVCAAAVIFIVGGVVVFFLWRRKFRPRWFTLHPGSYRSFLI